MNWKVGKGTEADAGTIAGFQIDMALESEGTILDRDKILNGVRAGLSDPAKGTYYIVRAECGLSGSFCSVLNLNHRQRRYNGRILTRY